jgi:membrane-bound hydrogenase subunit beta
MNGEVTIRQSLVERFNFLEGKVTIPRQRRIIVEAPREEFRNVLKYIAFDLKFNQLCVISGLDMEEDLEFIYHLANDTGIVLNLKLNTPKEEPVIQTVTDIFQGAVLYERELVDMFGAQVEGLPPGKRYPLPDDWPAGQYPLRKDWTPEQLSESKEG